MRSGAEGLQIGIQQNDGCALGHSQILISRKQVAVNGNTNQSISRSHCLENSADITAHNISAAITQGYAVVIQRHVCDRSSKLVGLQFL